MIDKPWSCQIELVRGCNFSCDFCGNYSLPKEKKYMSMDTLVSILSQLSTITTKIRLDYAMRGEPTLHHSWLRAVQLARVILPQSKITIVTNGSFLNPVNVSNFFTLGGNLLMVDCYSKSFAGLYKMLKETKYKLLVHGETQFSGAWGYLPPKTKIILMMPDIRGDESVTRNFTNQCDAISNKAYEKYGIQKVFKPLQKKCVNPFREITFHYNGDSPICCKDWVGSRILYNVNKNTEGMFEYWFNNIELNIIRRLLWNKVREFHPCKRCSFNGGFRLGFLPTMQEVISKYDKDLLLKQLGRKGMYGYKENKKK